MPSRPPRLGFVAEAVHGHAAVHGQLRRLLAGRADVDPWFAIVPPPNRVEARLIRRIDRLGELDLQPLRWRLRYSWRTRRLVRAHRGTDALLLETQACALLARHSMRELPWVLSVDATSRQYAQLEYWRPRDRFSFIGERAIEALERRAYRGAYAIAAWSEWTARSLRDDFDVAGDRIVVLHPGVALPDRRPPRGPEGSGDTMRALFVGNNIERKGIGVLRAALRQVDARVSVDVVTQDDIQSAPGLTVHRGVTPGSEELSRRYADADVLVAPTLADCVPLAVVEGMAAGLPVVSTDVGAVAELLGDDGIVTPPGDSGALADALTALARDPARRRELGRRAEARARESYDARRQADRLVALMRRAASDGPPR